MYDALFGSLPELPSSDERLIKSIRLQYPPTSRLLLGTTTNVKQPGFLKALDLSYPLELSIQCFNLATPSGFFSRLAGWSLNDRANSIHPFAIFLYREEGLTSEWQIIGRTETIQYDMMHRFVTKLKICCSTVEQRRKELRIEIYDRRTRSDHIEDQVFLGGAQCTMEDVICEPMLRKELKLESNRMEQPGRIVLSADAIRPSADGAKLYLNVDMASNTKGSHRVFYVLSRQLQSGEYTALYRSEVLGKNEKRFRPLFRDVGAITAGVEDKLLRLEIFQWRKSGHIRLGFMQTSMYKLRRAGGNTSLLWWPSVSCDGDGVISVGRVVVLDSKMGDGVVKVRLRVTQ